MKHSSLPEQRSRICAIISGRVGFSFRTVDLLKLLRASTSDGVSHSGSMTMRKLNCFCVRGRILLRGKPSSIEFVLVQMLQKFRFKSVQKLQDA